MECRKRWVSEGKIEEVREKEWMCKREREREKGR